MPIRDIKAAPKSKTTSKKVDDVKSSTKVKKPTATSKIITTSAKMITKEPSNTINEPTTTKKKTAKPATASKKDSHVAHAVKKDESAVNPYQAANNEEYMNAKQRDHFRQLLLKWRQQLMEEVDRTVHHMKDEAANFPDPNDRATQEEEFSLELRARDRERKLIKKIEEALQKIDSDDYGYCEACGIEIGIRRLEARPTANQCIDCKTLDEIKEKQIGGIN